MELPFWEMVFEMHDRMQNISFDIFVSAYGENINLTVKQMRLIRGIGMMLRNKPEGISLREVAEYMRITPGSASVAVEQLVAKGVLERTTNPRDRRGVNIALSSKMRKVADQISTQYAERFDAALSKLSPAEQEHCWKALNLLAAELTR